MANILGSALDLRYLIRQSLEHRRTRPDMNVDRVLACLAGLPDDLVRKADTHRRGGRAMCSIAHEVAAMALGSLVEAAKEDKA